MLADPVEFDKLVYPVLGSYKLDGWRCWLPEGKPVTRSLKDVPNKFIQHVLSDSGYMFIDGELIVGDPTDPDCYNVTDSACKKASGEPDFTFWAFDNVSDPTLPFLSRYEMVCASEGLPRVKVLDQIEIWNYEQLVAFEVEALEAGYEGIMTRQPRKPYKFGRSTARGGELNKLKRFVDAEAEILGWYEEEKNNNEATVNALGRTKRSTHQENKVGKGTLGGFRCRELAPPYAEFNCGGGKLLTKQRRAELWEIKETLPGQILKFSNFPIGRKDAPRFPQALGFRSPEDMS
jgi:DNA ligase-1